MLNYAMSVAKSKTDTPMDDLLLNKAAIVERCIRRLRQEYAANPSLDHPSHTDALLLNIERVCQASIDAAMHLISIRHLGTPQSSADAFRILRQSGILGEDTSRNIQAMVGFRNIAIHQYQDLEPEVIRHISETGWQDFCTYFQELGILLHP